MKKKASTAESLMTAIFGLMTLVFAPVWQGYVFTKLWGWFIVTTFAAPPVSVPVAIGICLLVSVSTMRIRKPVEDERSELEKAAFVFGAAFVCPLIILGVGLVAKAWM